MKSNNSETLRSLITAALFAALVFVATAYLPRIPTTNGYVHLGDSFIYLGAALLPLPYAMAAAAIGGSMADLLSGYLIWAPGTLIIKAALAVCFTSRKPVLLCARNYFALAAAALISAGGYFLYAGLVVNNFAAALIEIPANIAQGAASAIIFVPLALAIDKTPALRGLLKLGKDK